MAAKKKEDEELPGFVIVTGLSGSGMSSATDSFEDLGIFVDNAIDDADLWTPSIGMMTNIRHR